MKRFPACNCIIVSTCKEWCAIKEKGLSVGRDILRWKGRHNLFLVKALHSQPSALLLPHSLHPCSPQLGPQKNVNADGLLGQLRLQKAVLLIYIKGQSLHCASDPVTKYLQEKRYWRSQLDLYVKFMDIRDQNLRYVCVYSCARSTKLRWVFSCNSNDFSLM